MRKILITVYTLLVSTTISIPVVSCQTPISYTNDMLKNITIDNPGKRVHFNLNQNSGTAVTKNDLQVINNNQVVLFTFKINHNDLILDTTVHKNDFLKVIYKNAIPSIVNTSFVENNF